MALAGNLAEFSLADTLMLLSQQKKNGRLTLTHNDRRAELWLKSGRLISVRCDGKSPEDLIGKALVARGITTDKAFQNLKDSSSATEIKLSAAIQSKNYLDARECTWWFSACAEDMAFELFAWKKGNYEFEALPFKGDESLLEYDLAAEFLTFEAMRQLDESEKVRAPFKEIRQWVSIVNSEFEEYEMADDLYILRQIGDGIALQKLKDRFPFSDFRMYSRLENLRKEGFISFRAITVSQESKRKQVSLLAHPWLLVFLSVALLMLAITMRIAAWNTQSQGSHVFSKLSRQLSHQRQETTILEYATLKIHLPKQLLLKVRE